MLSSEERSGLVFTLVGGGLLAAGLLVWIGFFADSSEHESAPAADVKATAPLKLGAVRGRVVDARSGKGIATRSVDVRGLDGLSDHWMVEPDPRAPGSFEIRGLPAGKDAALELSADGFVQRDVGIDVTTGTTRDLGDVALVPFVSIAGTVVDACGAPLAGATVTLTHVLASGEPDGTVLPAATADGRGRCSFARLLPRRYELFATTSDGDAAIAVIAIDATAGGEQAELTLELFPTFTLRGRLHVAEGAKLPIAVVVQGRRAVVEPDGTFAIAGLHAGARKLVVIAAEIEQDAGKASHVASDGDTFDVVVPHDPLVVDFDPRLVHPVDHDLDEALASIEEEAVASQFRDDGPTGSLQLRATDGSGQPLAGARVTIAASGVSATPHLRFTNRAGECVVPKLSSTASWTATAQLGALEATAPVLVHENATIALTLVLVPPPSADPSANH